MWQNSGQNYKHTVIGKIYFNTMLFKLFHTQSSLTKTDVIQYFYNTQSKLIITLKIYYFILTVHF